MIDPTFAAMFQFQHPEYLWLLAFLPVLLLLFWGYRNWRRKAMAKLGETTRLLPVFSELRFWIKGGLLLLGWAFLAIAWANPQLGAKKQTTTQKVADVFIALDISQSMLCRDARRATREGDARHVKRGNSPVSPRATLHPCDEGIRRRLLRAPLGN